MSLAVLPLFLILIGFTIQAAIASFKTKNRRAIITVLVLGLLSILSLIFMGGPMNS